MVGQMGKHQNQDVSYWRSNKKALMTALTMEVVKHV
jgi:hypothetical protein